VDFSEAGQSVAVSDLLKRKRRGFFVECGAFDGERFSNSLFLERTLDWTGLLIETDPKNFELLKAKNRKAWLVHGCLEVRPFVILRKG